MAGFEGMACWKRFAEALLTFVYCQIVNYQSSIRTWSCKLCALQVATCTRPWGFLRYHMEVSP